MRSVAATALCLATLAAAAPAFADDSGLALFARASGGIAEGSKVVMGQLGQGTVATTADGVFSVTFADGTASLTYTEPKPCVFHQHMDMPGQSGVAEIEFDLNKAKSFIYGDQGLYQGLYNVTIDLQGDEDIVHSTAADGTVNVLSPSAAIISSFTKDDLTAAATALAKLCPGAAP